ncbi:uncharacterized protein LOC119067561 isoform X10 [Bradysia coprophila]|uniref:uncharacterized protein LOC119067561 isoform X10 n=1 Tax=Bradysia coprophila TaxID=38358 RepID=UPI00187DA5AD|nr:uncharacterized protein LOC119067561 isoform X10 [Bradysia coprophila]
MPWNCLCSSKDKRRPEISAPILNNEDIQKLQLIPLKKPLITSEHLQQKLVQPENNNSTTVVIVDVVPDCHDLDAVVRIDDKCVQKKQLNKKQKEKQNNKAKPSNLKKQLPSSTTTNPNNVENDKISKQLTNVKFTFEVNDTHNEKRKESDGGLEEDKIRPSSVQSETKKREEKIEEKQDQPLNDKSGNYDELPLIRIEEFADNTDDSQQLPKKSEHFSKSSESIPFIDESPRHQPQSNLFETRYITIEPQNIGSQSSKNPSNNNNIGKIESIHTSAVQKREQFDKSAQILYQSQMQLPVAHHFEMVQRLDVKLCQVCHEFLLEPKSVRCLTCGFVCHESCVATKKNYDAKTQQSIPKSQSFPLPSQYQKSSDNLGLNYVTERILGSVLPRRDVSDMHQHRPHSEGPVDVQLQDKYEKELILMLEQKHGKNYKMFDLESCISTITLEKLCELCKHIDSWLGSGREKVVVLQDRGDKQRLGAAIAAYLKYLDICASNYPKRNGISNEDIRAQNTIARNWLDLDMFSMRKFLEDVIGPLRVPSHCRYLNYFSGLLSGKIKMNSSPLYLKYVSIESPPSWMNYDSISTQSSEWRSFIKVYEGLNCVYTSDIHVIPISTRQFVYEVGQLRLRGDVIIRCYQLLEHAYLEKRELMFSTQFHTCAVTDKTLSFSRSELDYACDDPRFPSDHRVTLSFSDSSPGDNRGYNLKSPLVTIEPMNAIAKYDSLENFNDASSPHTHGPLDGSLYATILKSPKTPERSSSTIPQFPTGNNNNNNIQSTKQGATQNLISPPPEFSNHKKIEITERHSPYSTVNTNSVHNIGTQIRSSSSQSNRYTPTPTINYEEIRVPSRSSSREIVLRNSYSHQSTPRPSSSQSQYLDQRSSVSRASNYTPNPSSYPPTSHQVKAIESYHYTTVDNNNSGNNAGNYQDGRESVRSPLTLSMDSGISSSGIVNRRVQGSSVSPSSFPSQTSPQEDRQRELDDILSDMLLTVQDIPDIVKCKQHNTLTKKPQQNNNQIILTQHQQRSSSTTSTNTNQAKDRERDFYDTSSTTTTITPPPSESGRDTPIIVHTNSSNSSTLQHQRDKRESTHMQQQHRGTGEQIMDLQNQSFSYPQQVRTDIVYVTSEDEEIPYHAREDSRPFTYGNPTGVQLSPNGTGMLKMQSGLSSPSLVRKTLGSSTTPRGDTHKKTGVRNDFEEMLLQRREKVLNEKYSIGDKTPNGSAGQYGETKWSNISAPNNNGYHYHEPLKRSNTMDGGFGRSYSTDDRTSGQTWLQLQQQKLRAKKEQQNNGAEYFARKIHTENRNRPLRSRSSAAHRYDGYASDTAAFDVDAFIDEVDYRRPLHVQTPHNRSSDRNYHTITTTTTTKERPFVSVKRAHEQAKLNTIGVREESFSSYRSETEPDTSIAGSPRPETPAFPVTPRTPYGFNLNGNSSPALPPKSPTSMRRLNNSTWSLRSGKSSTSTYDLSKDLYSSNQNSQLHQLANQNDPMSCYTSRRNSTTSNANSEPQEVAPHLVKFVRDSSKYWYKPNISREEAVALLRNAAPGTFIVRDSTTFAKAYGLVVKVAYPPPGIQSKGPPGDELVRHFLVEPTTRGVRLKGCSNEPVFTSLSALVYQHSITPLALPCRLIIPDRDMQSVEFHSPAQQQLITQGAACNVLYLFTCETESLTGPEAVRKAITFLYSRKPLPKPTEVHFKVSHQGITLTDQTRQLFFRKHYPAANISHCGLDPEDRRWSVRATGDVPVSNKSIFAFVARRSTSSTDNQCHVFCELEPSQPATAITSFTNKIIPTASQMNVSKNI